jgi:hypothetical protein
MAQESSLSVLSKLPDTYRMTAVPSGREQRIRAALLWGGPEAAAAGRSPAPLAKR